jgi:hypothetical protein
MQLRSFLIVASAVYAGFGLGLLVAAASFMSLFGVRLDVGGELMARVYGAALVAFALTFWWSRTSPIAGPVRSLIRANCIFHVLSFALVLWATLRGVMGPSGWGPVILHAMLVAGFGYFGFADRESATPGRSFRSTP